MKFEKVVSSRETVTTSVVTEVPVNNTTETKIEQDVPVAVKETKVVESNPVSNEMPTKEQSEVEASNSDVETEEGIANSDETVEEVEKELSTDPFEARNNIYQGDYEAKPVMHSKKIRAQWNSKSKDKTNLFALHATAKKGSYIEVYNPMLDRMVIAKVVGNIPERIHKNNVELIVSPKVAETLGVVDKKFFVKIRYIED